MATSLAEESSSAGKRPRPRGRRSGASILRATQPGLSAGEARNPEEEASAPISNAGLATLTGMAGGTGERLLADHSPPPHHHRVALSRT